MDIRQLQYFITIADEGQITGAAKKLHIAQPALSQQLRLLEEELGAQLVERGSQKIRLTEAGQLLRDRACEVMSLLGATTQEIQDLTHGQKGTISIGTVPSMGGLLLPDRICAFHARFPEIDFQLYDGETFQLLDMLNFGLVDFVIVRSSFSLQPYKYLGLPSEPMLAAMQKDAQYGSCPDTIKMTELANAELIIHRGSAARVVEYCKQSGFNPRVFCRCNDVRSVLSLANTGMGVAIVPQSATAFIPKQNLICKEIVDKTLDLSRIIVWPKKRNLPPAAKNFLEMFID